MRDTVDLDRARVNGLTLGYDGRACFFCGNGCLLEFRDHPERYLDPRHLPTM